MEIRENSIWGRVAFSAPGLKIQPVQVGYRVRSGASKTGKELLVSNY
ncbi:MAG: hypothetical protein JRI97_11345 [Deltaproteobacteria bacterium]|nr:hypothetical protein [Deltaproteobacteria bacterium]